MVAWFPTSISLVLRTNAFRVMKCRPLPIGSNDVSHVVGSYRCAYGDQTSVGEMRQLICNPIGYHDVIPAPILWKKLYFACHRISVHDPDAVGCSDPSSFSHNLGYRDRPVTPCRALSGASGVHGDQPSRELHVLSVGRLAVAPTTAVPTAQPLVPLQFRSPTGLATPYACQPQAPITCRAQRRYRSPRSRRSPERAPGEDSAGPSQSPGGG